jgi:hypothetical protein
MAPPLIPVVLLGTGAYLAWFGTHYFGSDTKWPTDPVKAVLTGKPLPVPSGQHTAPAVAASIEATAATADTQTGVGATSTATGNSGAAGINYTKSTLETLWTSNGGSAGTANIASAIALAESSGQSQATSSNPDGGTNVGLWQLDTKGVGAGYTVAQLQAAVTNARVTIMGSANGTNWSAWATYASGAYKAYLT